MSPLQLDDVSILGHFSVYRWGRAPPAGGIGMLVALAIGGVFYVLVILFGLSIGRASRRGDETLRRHTRDLPRAAGVDSET